MSSRRGLGEEKIGKNRGFKSMNDDDISKQKCSFCGSANLETDDSMIKCLDCGMGNYKKGKHKGAR